MKIKINFKTPVCFLILILLPIILFNQILTGNIIVAGDLSGSDLLDLNLPFKEILHQNLAQGKITIWEPSLSMGFPILAEGQIGAFYPPNLLLALLPTYLAVNFSIILALISAGAFMFLYTRSLGFKHFPALVSAITFMFSAFFIVKVKHINMIIVASWVPFLFWTTKKLFQTRKLRFALFSGIGIALQLLAGHPEMAFFTLFIYLIYFSFEFYLSVKKIGLALTLPLTFLALPIAAAVGIGLSAIQVLPSLEFTQLTERTQYTIQTATAYPFHPKNLITFISPYYFGNPALGSYREDIRTTGLFWENASYIGFLPLILSFAALISILRRKPRSTYALFYIALAILSLLLMLGRFTPLYEMLWTLLPGFQLFRFPNRFNLFLIFSLAILSGIGAHLLYKKLISLKDVQTRKKGEEVRFNWPLKSRPTQAIICAVILVDLYVFATSYVGFISWEKFNQEPKIVNKLSQDQDFFRIYSLTQYGPSPYSVIGWKKDDDALIAIRQALPPNNNAIYNLDSFTDRSWFEGGLGLERRHRLENFIINENQDAIILGKLLGTFNVKYIITFADAIGIEIEKIDEYEIGEAFASSLKLFENKQVIPRAFLAPQAEIIKNEEAVFKRLLELEFNPTTTVILEKEPQSMPTQFAGAIDLFREENPVKITDYQNTEVTIKATTTKHSFLVLSDIFYPGWKATVDGNPQEILRANYLVRAIELEPGEHTIRFYYDPLSFKIGAAISTATLLAIVILPSLGFLIKKTNSILKKRSKK